jgi:hypothetical protein
MKKPKAKTKPISKWTGHDFLVASAKLNGTFPSKAELQTDATVAGAVLLAALTVGARITKVSKLLSLDRSRIEHLFDGYVRNGIFTSRGRVSSGVGADDPEEAACAFWLEVACACGFLNRVKPRGRQ